MYFDTSEKVTRFLRAKTGRPSDLLVVAQALISGDLDIYLPQKEVVLLDWWFDFVGNKKNALARCNKDYWNLLSTIWTSLKEDQETLSRVYLSHNFLTIFSDTLHDLTKLKLEETSETQVQELILAIANAIKTLGMSNLWFRIPSDSANVMIFSFLKTIEFLHINYFSLLEQECSISLTQQISNVLQATLYGTSDLRKLSTTFNSKCLGIAFITLGYDLPESIHSTIKSTVSVLQYDKEQETSDIDFTALSPDNISIRDKSITVRSIVEFYSIICAKAPQKAPNAFFSLTKLYPDTLKQLIKVAGEYQIKIKTESLISLVDTHLSNSNQIDWEFLELILDLESSVLTEENRMIKLLSTKSPSTESFNSFSKAFIKYYAEARELVQFILSWKNHILDGSPWCGNEVLNCLSLHIKSLSTHQLKGLMSSLVQPIQENGNGESSSQIFTPIIAVIMSFFLQQSPPAAVLYEPLFVVIDSDLFIDSELAWYAKYLILSLNSAIVSRKSASLLKQVKHIKYGLEKDSSDKLCLYVMQIIFRIREFSEVEKFDHIVKKILKHIGKKVENPEEFLQIINQRWLLVVNNCFDNENKERLVGLFAQFQESFQKLCSNEVFYEQRHLSKIVVTQIASELEKENIDLLRYKLLSIMPMEIVRRENRAKILTMLTNTPIDTDSLNNQVFIRTAIVRFLEYPTISTDIETKPHQLRDYFTAVDKIASDQLETITRSACERVIGYHALNYKNQEISEKYLKNLIDHEISFLNNLKPNKPLSSSKQKALDFSCLVAAVAPVEIVASAGLNDLLISVLLAQLQNTKSSIAVSLQQSILILRNLDRISSLSEKLNESTTLHSILGGYVSHAILELKNNELEVNSRQLLAYCFQLLARTSVSAVDIETVIALYTIVCEHGIEVDESILPKKLLSLNDTDFTAYLGSIVSECFNHPTSTFPYFKTAKVFASTADNSLHPSSIEQFIRLISLALSNGRSFDKKSLLTFFDLINLLLKDKTWIITQYALELIIAAITELSSEGPELAVGGNQDDAFVAATCVLSSILLFHRHRLAGRYFLITKVFSVFLTALANPRHALSSTRFSYVPKNLNLACELQLTEKSAAAYSRLLDNLCEPPIQAIRERGGKSNLTSASTLAKRQVSKFVGILLLNYVRLTLQTGFTGPIKKALTPGFYLVFDVLGEEKLRAANFLLDSNSRPYFKTLYEDFMSHGKWKND